MSALTKIAAAAEVIRSAMEDADLDYDRIDERTFIAKLPGQKRLQTACWLSLGTNGLSVEAFVIRKPDENRERVYGWLLAHNAKMFGVSWSIDDAGDIYLTGRWPLAAVELDSIDRLLGSVLDAADSAFNTLLELGFGSSIRREWAWRVSRGEPLDNLAAFKTFVARTAERGQVPPAEAELAPLEIGARFNGPSGSGNGGVTAGLLAARFDRGEAVEVTLRLPPPLDRQLTVEQDGDGLRLLDGELVVAQAGLATEQLSAVPPVSPEVAAQASTRYAGLHDHPFPTCYVCGTARASADGLGVYAGPVDPAEVTYVAAPFVAYPVDGPDPGLPGQVLVWAAMDCPGGWASGIAGRKLVLGRMAAQVLDEPVRGEACVVVAIRDGIDGRKSYSRCSLYGADGRLLGMARQTWIELR